MFPTLHHIIFCDEDPLFISVLTLRINYLTRIGTRVLWPISEFSCKNALDLYQNVKRIDWTRYIPNNKTFRVGTKSSLFVDDNLLRKSKMSLDLFECYDF
jgi:23S rRNA G2445 N2-methylase RlmL